MEKLTPLGEATLTQKNIISHTEVYINDALVSDIISYSINRSRKFGAAKLSLTVSNPDGCYTYQKQISRGEDPLFGYGNRIHLREGLEVNGSIEWFTQFTGMIVSQSPSNVGGKPALTVEALDNMKRLLDYVPDDLTYTPQKVRVTGEVLTSTDPDYMLFSAVHGNWVDIPYPSFRVDGVKQKGNYDVDLVNGQAYFGEKMYYRKKYTATKINDTVYKIPVPILPGYKITRAFTVTKLLNGILRLDSDRVDNNTFLPPHSINGDTVTFASNPFADLNNRTSGEVAVRYTDKVILISTDCKKLVQADYLYYVTDSNKAEDVIRDIALRAGFAPEQIDIQPTGVSLPPLRFSSLTTKNGFEAIQEVKKKIAPNYIVACDGEGRLLGYYAGQKIDQDYELNLLKRIQAPVSEESLYTSVIAHGIDLNPPDLARTATAVNLKTDGVIVNGNVQAALNKNIHDQISWRWNQKNNNTPPAFPIDLLQIDLAEPKKLKEINILVGDFEGGTIQQSMTVMVSENGVDWIYPDKAAQGLQGSSSQWVTVKGSEMENRLIKAVKIICESAFDWTDTHVYTKGGFLGIGAKTKTDVYSNWFFAIKEVQIWEENSISAAVSVANAFGVGNGIAMEFSIPNAPLVIGSETIYLDGQPVSEYEIDYRSGKVTFEEAPTGVLTADYSMITRKQAVTASYFDSQYGNNVGFINPEDILVFAGGDLQPGSPAHILLQKVGIKKLPLKIDKYLNSHTALAERAGSTLKETSRLKETLALDLVYRPDIEICQTVRVSDDLMGLSELYFVEDITLSKQAYRPSLSVKLSNYSAF